jgi:hypothetical protein
MVSPWYRNWLKRQFTAPARKRGGRRPDRRPGVEQLEDRLVPDSGGAFGVLTASGNLQLNPSNQSIPGFPQQVIPNVKIQLIFLSDPTNHFSVPAATQTAIHNYFTTITSDGYITTLLAQYGNTQGLPAIGNGSVGVVDTTASASPDTTDPGVDNATHPAYTDAKLESIIQGEITNGHSAAADGLNNLYFIFTPQGDIVDGGGGATSANTFLGYHSAFEDTNTKADFYAVIPDQTPNGVNLNEANVAGLPLGLNAVQGEETTSAHEMAEAITDCIPVQGWVNPTLGGTGEVGDMAANEYYIQDGRAVQYEWSNALVGPAHAPGTGAADIFINQVSPPAVPVSTSTSVPVASFTTANTALTTANFSAEVFSFDRTGHGLVQWTVTSIAGSNGHFVVNASPNTAVTAGTYGQLFSQQQGLYVIVQDTLAADATKIDGPPTTLRYAPYVVTATSDLNYVADSGSGTNNFVLKENAGNFELRDNGNLVFTQPIALTNNINIKADPAVPGANVDDSLTIDYTGGTFNNAVNFDGGPGSGTHTLTFQGGTFTNETYNYTGPTGGNVNLDGQVVTFSHTTALADSDTVTNDAFNLPGVNNSVTFQESGTPGTPLQLGSSGTFPTTQFTTPSSSLTIASAVGTTNTITVGALTDLKSALTINGNIANDTVNLNGALTLGNAGGNTGNLSVTAKVISVTGKLDVTGGTSGTMTLHSGTTIATSGGGLLKATTLALTAGGAIGSSGTPLAIDATTLTADTSSGNANQFLSDAATVKVTAANGLNAGNGTITLAGGTFLIDGSTASTSPVAVNSGATLGGKGTVAGPVTINSGATLAPGDNGVGALATGALTINTGGTFAVEIGGKTAGTGYDQVNVSGAASLGGTIIVSIVNGFTPSAGDSYQVLTFTSKSSDFATQSGFNLGGGLTLQEQFSPAVNPTSLNLAVINTATGPTVTGVGSTTANGTYGAGAVIDITVGFSAAVNVTGTPQLALSDGGTASYTGGSGTSTLTFTYTVAAGQTTNGGHLDEASAGALTPNGGTITDGGGNAAVLTLPAPGAAGSLGANTALIINAAATGVSVTNVTSSTPNGIYGIGRTGSATIRIQVNFSGVVNVTSGRPQLSLNNGGTAFYTSGSGSSTLTFTYTVGSRDQSTTLPGIHLDYSSPNALTGGIITDSHGAPVNETLPAPGAAGSLAADAQIFIYTGRTSNSSRWQANPDSYTATSGVPMHFASVLLNDLPNTPQPPTFQIISPTVTLRSGPNPAKGSKATVQPFSFHLNSDGTFTIQVTGPSHSTVQFVYVITDSQGNVISLPTTVTITIQ